MPTVSVYRPIFDAHRNDFGGFLQIAVHGYLHVGELHTSGIKSILFVAFRAAVIFDRVCDVDPPFYRPVPHCESTEMDPILETMMKLCWSEQPAERPSFDDVLKTLRRMNKGKLVDRSVDHL